MNNESKIIRDAIRKKFYTIVENEINENDISPEVITWALLTCAATVSAKHQGIDCTATLIREFASGLEENLETVLN